MHFLDSFLLIYYFCYIINVLGYEGQNTQADIRPHQQLISDFSAIVLHRQLQGQQQKQNKETQTKVKKANLSELGERRRGQTCLGRQKTKQFLEAQKTRGRDKEHAADAGQARAAVPQK